MQLATPCRDIYGGKVIQLGAPARPMEKGEKFFRKEDKRKEEKKMKGSVNVLIYSPPYICTVDSHLNQFYHLS